MAIAVDGSTPARFTGTPADNVDITSASFTPPAGALLVCCVSMNSNGVGTLASVSDSQGGTWVEDVRRNFTDGLEGHASVWHRLNAPNTSMTVSVRRTNSSGGGGDPDFNRISAKCYVVTGAHASSPVPTVGEGSSATNNLTASIFTSAFANSFAFVAATDWNANGTPTSSDLTVDAFHHAGVLSGMSGFKSLGATGAKTANLDAAGTAAAEWNWAAVEVREDAGPEFSGTLVSAVATLSGNLSVVGGFSGTLAAAAATLAGDLFTSHTFSGNLGAAAAQISGVVDNTLQFEGSLFAQDATIAGEMNVELFVLPQANVRIRIDRGRPTIYLGRRS